MSGYFGYSDFVEAFKALPGTRWYGIKASYHSWRGMKDRLSPNNKDFKHYSARGVVIDPRWMSYANFLEDMGEPPEEGMTLDRIDPLGPYSRANCRWASKGVQSQNRVFNYKPPLPVNSVQVPEINIVKSKEIRKKVMKSLREAESKEPLHNRLKLEQYQSQIRALLDDSDSLDRKITTETKQLIEEMRWAVIDRIRQVQGRIEKSGGSQPEWGHFWLSRLVADFNGIIVAVSAKFKKNLTNYTIKAYEVGRDFADKSLEFAAPELNLNDPEIEKKIPKLSKDGARIAAQFPGDLITGMEEKQLAAISKEVSISISLGEPPGGLMSRLEKSVDKGVWATSYARAEVIARTETARIQELGRKQRLNQQQRAFPGIKMYQQYLVEPIRQWPCKMCSQYDGNVYDSDGRLFILAPGKKDGDMPDLPLHPNCFTGDTVFSSVGDIEILYRRKYSGKILKFFIGSEFREIFSVTPNHPILTDRGWLPAGEINEGDYLIGCFFSEDGSAPRPNVNVNNPKTTFEEKFSSQSLLTGFTAERATGTTPQFHGDGGTEDVDIVFIDSQLRNTMNTRIGEPLNHHGFPVSDNSQGFFSRFGRVISSLSGSCSAGSVSSLFEGHSGCTKDIGFRSVSNIDSSSKDSSPHNRPRDFEMFCNSEFGDSRRIHFRHFVVNRIEVSDFSGHVYNLQTSSGVYVAGNDGSASTSILSSNCRCCLIPWVPGLSQDPKEGHIEQKVSKAEEARQAQLSKMVWDGVLGIWVVELPDGQKRTMMMPKNTPMDDLKKAGMGVVRSAGFVKSGNVVLIQHPREMVGEVNSSFLSHRRIICESLSSVSR